MIKLTPGQPAQHRNYGKGILGRKRNTTEGVKYEFTPNRKIPGLELNMVVVPQHQFVVLR